MPPKKDKKKRSRNLLKNQQYLKVKTLQSIYPKEQGDQKKHH